MFPHQEHVWFFGCVFNTLCPKCAFSCIGHVLHIAISYTHLCYPCHALVYILFFFSSQYVMFTLCFVVLCFVLGLSFILSFISHSSCIIIIVRSFISCPLFSLTLCLFLTKRERVYSKENTIVFLSFLYDSCAHPQGEKFYFSCTFVGGEIFHRGDAYTKGEKTLS